MTYAPESSQNLAQSSTMFIQLAGFCELFIVIKRDDEGWGKLIPPQSQCIVLNR